MKSIPLLLINDLKKLGTAWCFCIKVKTTDGELFGYTNLDTDLTVFDGTDTIRYSSQEEMTPQNIQTESNFEVDNTDLLGWFDENMEKLVVSGKFGLAEITIYRVAYQRPQNGVEIVAYGTVGEVDFAQDNKGKRKIEFRSLMQQLKQKVNENYSLLCRAQFGDERCGMPFVWETATVSAVDDVNLKFSLSGVTRPDGWFDFGVIEFTSGDNVGKDLEVESWLSTGQVVLSFVTPYPVKVGDQVRIRRDCGKTETDCMGYGNIINMRAEHLTPVENSAVMVPGAYVKSVGAK